MNEAPKVPGNNPLPSGTNPASGAQQAATNPKAAAMNTGTNVLDKVTDKVAGDNGPDFKVGDQVAPPAGSSTPSSEQGGNQQNNSNNAPSGDENSNAQDGVESESTSESQGETQGGSQEASEEPQYKPGDKIAPGMEIGEDGKVKQTAVSRLQTGIAQGAAAYVSGGNTEAMDAAKNISNSKTGRRISDQLEKNKLVNKVAEEAEDAGVLDTAEGAMDAISDLKNHDVQALKEDAKKVKEGSKKLSKKSIKTMLIISAFVFVPVILCIVLLFACIGGIQDENDTTSDQIYKNAYEYDWPDVEDEDDGKPPEAGGGEDGDFTPISNEDVQEIIKNIPGWDSLSAERKRIITNALSAVGLPYTFGSKPTGPGLSGIPEAGLDCSGFVDWAYWSGLGSDPGFSSTANMVANSSTWFNSVSYDQMKPGDVAVRRTSEGGHTAIYLGNDNWVHASGKKVGIIVKKNSNRSYYQYHYAYRGI